MSHIGVQGIKSVPACEELALLASKKSQTFQCLGTLWRRLQGTTQVAVEGVHR